jgi:hypothetical protein
VLRGYRVRFANSQAVEFGEAVQEAPLLVARRAGAVERAPGDQQLAGIGQLPDVAAAPMPDRLAGAEAGIGPHALPLLFALADVDRLR